MEDDLHNLKIVTGRPVAARFTVRVCDSYEQRITIPLGTRDIGEAQARRDIAEAAVIAASRAFQGYSTE
tara:strand:- start:3861 stop:4067 length:207 start_codon:yes stop_codon:yes gene_type:complete